MSLTSRLRALLNYANEKTGVSDPDLGEAIRRLVDGYGQGSSDVPFDFGGLNAVKVASFSKQYTLADTSFVIGTSASTTSTTIRATVSNEFNSPDSPTIAYGDKDIVVVQRIAVNPTHGDGASGKVQQIKYTAVNVAYFSKRKTTDTSGKSTRQITSMNTYINKYFNTSGVVTRAVSNYGFYATPQAPSMASNTSANTYVRCNSPILYYRASSSYESTANIKLVEECTYDWEVDVYTVDPFTSPMAYMNTLIDEAICD